MSMDTGVCSCEHMDITSPRNGIQVEKQKKGRRGEGKERKMQRKVVVSTTPLVMDKR